MTAEVVATEVAVSDEQVEQFFESNGEIQETPEVTENVTENVTETEETPTEEPKSDPREKMVPLPALHEERMKRKELQRQLQEIEQRQKERDAILEKRLEALMPKEPELKYEDDPAEFLRRQTEQLKNQQNQYNQYIQQMEEQRRMQAQQYSIQNQVAQLEAEFSRENPDYQDALNYVREIRSRELTALGLNQDEIRQTLMRDSWGIAQTALQRERNPAQAIYEIAKGMGYKRAQTEDKIDTIQKGMAVSKAPSGKPPQKLSIEALANMSDDEFSKLTEDQWRKMMGG